jgi:XcyI restriction endonuclease
VASLTIPLPDSSRQIAFHELLVTARRDWLIDAVTEALSSADPDRIRGELSTYVPADVHLSLAVAGLPDEYVFPLPSVLEAKPTLVGYYRLLLGLPRKSFYGTGTGMGPFKLMEEKGTIRNSTRPLLPDFCGVMSEALAEMVRQLSPAITRRDLMELPVMTLGQQFQGANNNSIGNEAIDGIFRSIRVVVEPFISSEDGSSMTITNPTGRSLRVVLSSDPDLGIEEVRGDSTIKRLALEIKGGSDRSNQHNRIGEAEKSHIKAKAAGYSDFWTIIRTKTLDDAARLQSPTSRLWFDAAQVLARSGPDWDEFAHEVAHVLGIPNPNAASRDWQGNHP